MIRLGVNVDHVATLRQVRGGTTAYPDLLKMVELSAKAGASQITIHLREDRRHIQESDLKLLTEKSPLPLNLEMAITPKMIKMALKYLPDWVCLVPEKRQELTTEGGLNVVKYFDSIKKVVSKLQPKGIEISVFIEPSLAQVKAANELGVDAVEFHTGKWVLLKGTAKKAEWKKLVEAAKLAHKLGLKVHAGHGLDLQTTKEITKLPHLLELNIGHSIVCYALEFGFYESVKKIHSAIHSKN